MLFPPFLQKGQRVAVVAPAGKLATGSLDKGLETLAEWGLEVVPSTNLWQTSGYLAGTDEQRLSDLQKALDDPEIHAIIAGRGGYGTTRLLDQLDFSRFLHNPKWIVGFSDLTALHAHLSKLGVASLHAPVLTQFAWEGAQPSLDILHRSLFGKLPVLEADPSWYNRNGLASGRLVGGNLAVFMDTLGTSSHPETEGAILFLEDVGESLYKLDRMMNHLYRTGILAKLNGLVIGHISGVSPDDNFGIGFPEIVRHHTREFSYPVGFGFPIGHEPANHPVICGADATLDVSGERSSLQFSLSSAAS